MKRSSKIAIISGIVAVVLITAALTVHFRLLETEKSEIASGAEQNENAETNENTEQNENVSTTTVNHIEISVIEVDKAYRWSSSTGINPPITLTVNTGNTIRFTNPTDTKHAFIIGQNGTVILATKDLGPGLSGKISVKPTKTGVFEYHCKYHPDTMKGILNVEP